MSDAEMWRCNCEQLNFGNVSTCWYCRAKRGSPDWRSLCAQLAEALERGYVGDDECKYGADAQCDENEPPCRYCRAIAALTAYNRALGNRSNSSESSPPGVGESGGE